MLSFFFQILFDTLHDILLRFCKWIKELLRKKKLNYISFRKNSCAKIAFCFSYMENKERDSVRSGSWIFVWNTVASTSIRLAKSVSCIVSFFFFLSFFYPFINSLPPFKIYLSPFHLFIKSLDKLFFFRISHTNSIPICIDKKKFFFLNSFSIYNFLC